MAWMLHRGDVGPMARSQPEPNLPMKKVLLQTSLAFAMALSASWAAAQSASPAAAPASAAQAPVWKYKTPHLTRAEVDALLAQPDKLLVLDVRRPDELIKYGSFPVFISVQAKELEKQLAYLPKDRVIVTVSNHAQRAGAAGDLLASHGFKIAGATGSEDYEHEGGKAVAHIVAPPPAVAVAATAASAAR